MVSCKSVLCQVTRVDLSWSGKVTTGNRSVRCDVKFVLHQCYLQVGIVSYGDGCAEEGSPGIYTRLAHYTSWIESVINASLTTTTQSTTTTTTGSTTTGPATTTRSPAKYSCNKNASCGCGVNDVTIGMSRIIGGEEAIPYSWSMIVSFRFGREANHACGGTLLSESHILTAAHCVGNADPNTFFDFSVAVGIHNRSEMVPAPTVRRVRRFFVHPLWKKGTPAGENDIAILELARPVDIGLQFRTTRTCLPQLNSSVDVAQYPPNHTELMVAGWGALEFGSFDEPPKNLRQAQIFLVDSNDPTCNGTIKNPRSQLCAGLAAGGKGQFCTSHLCCYRHIY